MRMGLGTIPRSLLVVGVLGLGGATARGQGPTIDTPDLGSPGAGNSPFGKIPGMGGGGPGQDQGTLISGRPGPTTFKGITSSISNPGMAQGSALFAQQGVAATPNNPAASVPSAGGLLAIPITEEVPGPADGLTLDQAINRVVSDNIPLRSKFYEIPQAKADILTASLRANPVFYADAQLVPYGQYTRERPGGQTQYDVNISYPLDLSRKRQARTASAVRATRVIEALYQDAVRQTIDNLYTAYVDVLQARRSIDFSKASLKGLQDSLSATEDLFKQGTVKYTAVRTVRIQRDLAMQQVLEGEIAIRKAKQNLATQLNIPADQADSIELYGTLKSEGAVPPSVDEAVMLALTNRPDVLSNRLGLDRAKSDVKLQYANRFQDVYVLYQPYTLQNNAPFGLKSPISWALGVTVPLPIYNRNQGNIERAKLNVKQTEIDLTSVERQAIQDVRVAYQEYEAARASVERIEATVLPDAQANLADQRQLFPGEIDITQYLQSLQDYNDTAKTYLDSQVRLRRAVLDINTAVGQRILP